MTSFQNREGSFSAWYELDTYTWWRSEDDRSHVGDALSDNEKRVVINDDGIEVFHKEPIKVRKSILFLSYRTSH
jgi:hypothetical protein